MVPDDDEFALVDNRRTSFAQAGPDVGLAQITFPLFLPVEVIAMHARGAEPTVETLAVGGR